MACWNRRFRTWKPSILKDSMLNFGFGIVYWFIDFLLLFLPFTWTPPKRFGFLWCRVFFSLRSHRKGRKAKSKARWPWKVRGFMGWEPLERWMGFSKQVCTPEVQRLEPEKWWFSIGISMESPFPGTDFEGPKALFESMIFVFGKDGIFVSLLEVNHFISLFVNWLVVSLPVFFVFFVFVSVKLILESV